MDEFTFTLSKSWSFSIPVNELPLDWAERSIDDKRSWIIRKHRNTMDLNGEEMITDCSDSSLIE